jgi:lysophospholipase L1-like esterase
MKKALTLILFLIVVTLLFFIFKDNENEITNIDSGGTAVLAFGNSLVKGVGAKEDENFVSILSTRLGIEIINRGVSGDTTERGLKRIDEALSINPRAVILLLGGNDSIRGVSVDETFNNLSLIIEKIHENGGSVLLVGVQSGIIRDKYKDEFKKLSKKHNTAYVPDILDGIFGNPKFMADPIHPNRLGYSLMADKIEPTLRELLQI